MEEEKQMKIKVWKKWVIYLLLSLGALLIIVSFIFPPLYTRLILRPMMEETFIQITDDAYDFDFDQLSWNLYKSHIFLNNIHIKAKLDSSHQQNIRYLYLDTLIIKNIHYWKLLKGEANIKVIDLKNLELKVHLFSEQDSSQQLHTDLVNKSGFINSFEVGDFNLDRLSLEIMRDGDSLMAIYNADFNVFNFIVDSLNSTISLSLPSYDELRFSVDNLRLKQEKNHINIKSLSFSDHQESKQLLFKFDEILMQNEEEDDSQLLKNGMLGLDHVSWFVDGNTPYLKGKDFIIEMESFENSISQIKPIKAHEIIEKMQLAIVNQGLEFEFESFGLQLKSLIHNSPQVDLYINNLDVHVQTPLMRLQQFQFAHPKIQTAATKIILKPSGDTLHYERLSYLEEVSKLELKAFNFKDPQSGKSVWSFNRLVLDDFHPLEMFEDKLLNLAALRIYQPKMIFDPLPLGGNSYDGFPLPLNISKMQVFEGDFEWQAKGWVGQGINMSIDSVIIPKAYTGPWEEVFHRFQAQITSLRYQSIDQYSDAYVGHLLMDSERESMYFEVLDFNSVLSNKRSRVQVKDVLMSGLNWKDLLYHSEYIELDTLMWHSMDLEGSIYKNEYTLHSKETPKFQVICNYLNLPNILAHLEVESQIAPSQILFEDLAIQGLHVSYHPNRQEIIQSDQLLLSSGFTSFAHSLDSLLLSTNHWQFDLTEHKFSAQDIHFQNLSHDLKKKTLGEIFLVMDSFQITGLQPWLYYHDKQIKFDGISFLNPDVSYRGERYTDVVYDDQSLGLYEKLQESFRHIKSVGFNHFNLQGLGFELDYQYYKRKDHIEINNVDVVVSDLFLDDTFFEKQDRFQFYKDLELDLFGYSQNINNGERLLDINRAEISSLDNRIYFKDFRLLSLGDSIPFPVNLDIEDVLFKDLQFISGVKNPQMYLGGMFINRPKIELKDSKLQNTSNEPFDLEHINLFPFLKDQISSLTVDHIEFNDCDFRMPLKVKGFSEGLNLEKINFKVEGVFIDSNNIAFAEKKFLYSDDISLMIPDFSVISSNRLYNIGFQELSMSSRNKSIQFDSLMLQSRYDRKTFLAQLKYQKDQVDILVPSLLIQNVDYREAIFRDRFKAGQMAINEAQFLIYKDKTIAPDTSIIQHMPAQLLKDLDFYLNIDTLVLNDGYIKYEEFNHMMDHSGELYFDQVNGMITGISNDADFRIFGGALKLDVTARLMSEAMVSLYSVFPLNSSSQEFLVVGSMGGLKATALNPLIQPLTLLSAKDGYLEQMQMNISGNNHFAYGEMLLKYEDLKIEVLNKDLKESALASFLANAILIKKNNNNFFVPRKGAIYFDRIKYRSFFNYLSHFAIVGAKTSIGIDQRKTARKIKKIERRKN